LLTFVDVLENVGIKRK